MTDQYRDQKNSVQRGDLPMLATGGGAALFLIPAYDQMGPYRPAPYDLPPDLAGRDQWLRQSPKLETMWANAVGIATTKMAAWQWDVESSVPIRAKRARELLLHADGGGWVRFVSKIGRDYLTTSNGMFIEIERFGKGYGSRIKALHHLDSARCRRTGDPEIPVVYTSLDGREHEMRYWQVLAFSDMPETAAEKLGIGFPAAQRAWRTIAKMAQMERYVWESVSGRTPTKLHFVGNAHLSEVEQAVTVADAKANKQLWAAYQGAVIVGSVAADQPVSLVSVPLKEMPEHFNPEQERKVSYLHYAAAIGLDPQDLQPITNQSLGAGAQSQVLDEKAKGQGLAALRLDLIHQISEMVLDERTQFAFSELDWKDEERKAGVAQTRANTRKTQIDSGELTVDEARQMAADAGDIPMEFIPEDRTSSTTLSDSEKPVEQDDADGSEDSNADDVADSAEKAAPSGAVSAMEAELVGKAEEYLLAQYQAAAAAVRAGMTTKVRIGASTGFKAEPEIDVTQLPLDFDGEEWVEVMREYYPLVLRESWDDAMGEIGLELAFDLDNPYVQEVLDELAHRVRAVSDTTVSEIQALVGQQADEGWSVERLADEIEQLGEIRSKVRAYVIAATETADAHTRGALLAYKRSGVVAEVEWLVFQPCEICEPLAGTRVKLGKKFSSGAWSGYGPPVHPLCRCSVAPIVEE